MNLNVYAFSASWKRLADFMLSAFQDMDPNVRLQAVKILENYIKGESATRIDTPVTPSEAPTASAGISAAVSPRLVNHRWLHNAQVYLQTAIITAANVCRIIPNSCMFDTAYKRGVSV